MDNKKPDPKSEDEVIATPSVNFVSSSIIELTAVIPAKEPPAILKRLLEKLKKGLFRITL